MMAPKSKAATGQWNQILCMPVKILIRIRKADTVRAAATGRGSFASPSETKPIQLDDSDLSRCAASVCEPAIAV